MNEDKRIYDWANAEEVAKVIAEVRRAALLEAAKVMCYNCKENIPLIQGETQFHQTHPSGWYCRASEIHKLLAEEAEAPGQAQGQEREER